MSLLGEPRGKGSAVVRRGPAGVGGRWAPPRGCARGDQPQQPLAAARPGGRPRKPHERLAWWRGSLMAGGARGAAGHLPGGAGKAQCREGTWWGSWMWRSASVCERRARLVLGKQGIHASVCGPGQKRGDVASRQPVSLL